MVQKKRRWSLVVGRWQKRVPGRRQIDKTLHWVRPSFAGRQKPRRLCLFKHKNAPAMLPEHLGIPDG
jgi:hypothetical protein